MKADIWMPLHIGDYLSDTTDLNTTEHGAYILLLMTHWKVGDLPDDDAKLARIAKLRIDHWRKIAPTIRAFFGPGGQPGTLRQKRLHAERTKAVRVSEKRAEAARQRWENAEATPQGVAGSDTVGKPLKSQRSGDASACEQNPNSMTQLQPPISGSLRSPAAAFASANGPVGEVEQAATAVAPAPANDHGAAPGDPFGDLFGSGDAPQPSVPPEEAPAEKPSPNALLHSLGLQLLGQMLRRDVMTKAGREAVMGQIGVLKKDARNDPEIVLAAIEDAHRRWRSKDTELAKPFPWLRRACQERLAAKVQPSCADFPAEIDGRSVEGIAEHCFDLANANYDGLWQSQAFTALVAEAMLAGKSPEGDLFPVMKQVRRQEDRTKLPVGWFRTAFGLRRKPDLKVVAA